MDDKLLSQFCSVKFIQNYETEFVLFSLKKSDSKELL